MSSPRRAAAALLVLATVSGCDTGDGRALRDPPPGATAPPLPTSSTATTAVIGIPPVGSGDAEALVLASPSFLAGTAIPARHSSCDGEDVSPALSWSGVPSGTVELALTVIDPDAPGGPFVHWVVAGIDPVVLGFDEGGLPETAVEIRPWTGPCPPPGETHDYVFSLYALTTPSGVSVDADGDANVDIDTALMILRSTPDPTTTLTGTYGRPTA